MKALLTFLCLLPLAIFAQTDTIVRDTTIYDIADEVPRFPTPCETLDTTAAVKSECSQIGLLDYINQRALYTAEAREKGISGMAVIGFVVEANGIISKARILRDPGANLGLSALRSVIGMAKEVRWRPAIKDGKPVRFNFVLPVRFRIEEPKPYVVTDRDTIYTELTEPVAFNGAESLGEYFTKNVQYPASGEDSCRTGQMDLQLLIHPNGRIGVQDITDYSNLGSDFTFEAVNVATQTIGKWTPGEYEGRPVTSAYDISFAFSPTSDGCQQTVVDYNEAIDRMNEGQVLVQDSTTIDAGLMQMDKAIDAFPADGRFRILRGQTRMDNNLLEGACEDLTLAREIALINWYDSVLPLLCRGGE
ncbi:MAG: TonB family protein [Neolewinella sp.]|jgi:TonB family protein